MEEITDLTYALNLLIKQKRILVSKGSNNIIIYYAFKNNMIMLFGENFKTFLEIKDFENDFYLNHYYLYESNENEMEIDQEFKPIRQ